MLKAWFMFYVYSDCKFSNHPIGVHHTLDGRLDTLTSPFQISCFIHDPYIRESGKNFP